MKNSSKLEHSGDWEMKNSRKLEHSGDWEMKNSRKLEHSGDWEMENSNASFWFCIPFSDKFSFKSISISIKVDLIILWYSITGGAPRRCKDTRRTFLLSMDQNITWNNAKRSWGRKVCLFIIYIYNLRFSNVLQTLIIRPF
jgi:hypothetical protein